VRPALKPGLLPVWRDRDTLQIGIDARRAVALTGMAGIAWVISLLDGSRDRAEVIKAAADGGVPPQAAERVLALLAAAGVIDDFPASTLRVLPHPTRARLAPELATASLAHGDGDGGARTLARRIAAHVTVYDDGRVGSAIAVLLRRSGIGRVVLANAATASGGLPSVSTARPDLAVLTGHRSPDLQDLLMRGQVPHLAVSATEAIGVVGPLVIPGRSSCLRCLDLTRTDRDPAWPLILAQLTRRQPDPPACDAPLAAAVAAQAAFQALALIDRAAFAEAVTNGTLELVLPGWQWRRRTWPPHPGCCCRSSAGS
jgi:bacteriocin biosynthesis cyclodehydratase domain-containing protein